MIELKKICKTYHMKEGVTQALHNIDMHIAPGEIFGIIGQSGAGKSTLLHCINLLERPTSGQVFLGGEELTVMKSKALRQARRNIGMIFQHFNLLASKTVFQNVALPLKLQSVKQAEIRNKVHRLLDLVGLNHKENQYPAQLSGGEKQRVAIARALSCDPKILLSDEATSALDSHTTYTILKLLKAINQQLNLTILLITHELSVVKSICDRIAVIDKGKIVEEADVISLFTHPSTQITKKLVNSHLKQKLPSTLEDKLIETYQPNSIPIIQITFFGAAAQEPVIAHLVKDIGVNINILQSNIELIKNETVGVMIVELIASETQVKQVLHYLQSIKLRTEILGYVINYHT